jgi:hypothetical protein
MYDIKAIVNNWNQLEALNARVEQARQQLREGVSEADVAAVKEKAAQFRKEFSSYEQTS